MKNSKSFNSLHDPDEGFVDFTPTEMRLGRKRRSRDDRKWAPALLALLFIGFWLLV